MNKVNIIITHKCNLMCKHCYMNAGNKECENYKLIFKNFKSTIKILKGLGVNEIMLTGGECTISPIFFEILDYCKKSNIKISIFTNGVIFDKKTCDYVDDYCLSIDGLKDNHNYLRGNFKAYDSTIKTIKYLHETKKNITIQVTVTKSNITEILEIIYLIYSLGVKKVNLCCLLDDGRSIDNNLDSNIDLIMLESIIKKAYRKTGYNVKIYSNVFNKFDTNIYLKTKSITFPLWIDLVDNCFYLIKGKSVLSKNLADLSKENIDILNENVNNYISKKLSNWLEREYYVLENEILKLLLGGDEGNE